MTLFKCLECANEHETDIHTLTSFCRHCGNEMIIIKKEDKKEK